MRALAIIAVLLLAAAVQAAEPQAVSRQQSLARERMQEVERRLLELADLLEPQEPARAEALRRALQASRQDFIVANMAEVQSLIQGGNYGSAGQKGQQVLSALQQLDAILAEETRPVDLDVLLAAEGRLADLARRQADAAARTKTMPEAADSLRAAAQTQRDIAADLAALIGQLQGAEPSDDLKGALSLMSDAAAALASGRKAHGLSAQSAAQQRLEDAHRRLLAAIARRRRSEQAEARAGLIAALQKMLDEQTAIRRDTEALAKEAGAGPATRAHRLRAQALAEREKALSAGARSALDAVVHDGTTIALPAALGQVKEDVAECARLLGEARAGPDVVALQRAIESTLQALIEALQAARQADLEQPQKPQEQPAGQQGRKPPLVDVAQELRVLRALQAGLNAQTDRLGAQPAADTLRSRTADLAERQGALAQAVQRLAGSVGEERAVLDGVANGMEKAQGLLAAGTTGRPVQSAQAEVLAQLDALIARYEEKASAQAQPQQMPTPAGSSEAHVKPAEESILPPGDWRRGRLPVARALPGDWAPGLPPAEQQKIAETFSAGRLPARYRELLREYNKRLAQP